MKHVRLFGGFEKLTERLLASWLIVVFLRQTYYTLISFVNSRKMFSKNIYKT